MTQELSKDLVCIVIRGGIEIWVEQERAEILKQSLLSDKCPQFINYENKLINKADITGIFDALVMEEKTRLKNGQWKCQYGTWHDRFEKCDDTCIINKLKQKYEKS